jgi:hypothetical protein
MLGNEVHALGNVTMAMVAEISHCSQDNRTRPTL